MKDKIKILNENIEGMPEYCRVEIDHKIQLMKKSDIKKPNTFCGYPFNDEINECETCDNFTYCKEQEKKK